VENKILHYAIHIVGFATIVFLIVWGLLFFFETTQRNRELLERNQQISGLLESTIEGNNRTIAELRGIRNRERIRLDRERAELDREKQAIDRERKRLAEDRESIRRLYEIENADGESIETIKNATNRITEILETIKNPGMD